MTSSLAKKFSYGNFGAVEQFHLDREQLFDTPEREREMIYLAERHIEAQNAATLKISKSQIAGSKIIANEISSQAESMKLALSQIGDRITDGISGAGSLIAESIEVLGDIICAELSEIK